MSPERKRRGLPPTCNFFPLAGSTPHGPTSRTLTRQPVAVEVARVAHRDAQNARAPLGPHLPSNREGDDRSIELGNRSLHRPAVVGLPNPASSDFPNLAAVFDLQRFLSGKLVRAVIILDHHLDERQR